MKGDKVNLLPGVIPDDYHCDCHYCKEAIGELRPADGSYYSRLERRQYYSKEEGKSGHGHIAKTPLHIARWAIQQYTEPGDWVLDPTIGAGTTAVEAITQGRNVAGMELQFGDVVDANVKANLTKGTQAKFRYGDARNIGQFLNDIDQRFKLVVNNPPYSGDESDGGIGKDHKLKGLYGYDRELPNIAFLNEGKEYWDTLRTIYAACIERLEPGGHFVTGVKDMMRKKEPFLLHLQINQMMEALGLSFVGTAFLKHYPTTLFLNTYFKQRGVHPPYYQTIGVWQKPEE